MKKLLFTILLFGLFANTAFSQLKGGIKGGLNISDLIVTNRSGYFEGSTFNALTSYHFGTFVKNDFGKNFGWQVEILFSRKGYVLKTQEGSTNVGLNYLNWPIMLLYSVGKKADVNVGLEMGFLIAGEEQFNNFDIGINIGAEYDISNKFLVGFRYNHGFPFKMNINTFEDGIEAPSYQNSVIQFYLGFNIVKPPEQSAEQDESILK